MWWYKIDVSAMHQIDYCVFWTGRPLRQKNIDFFLEILKIEASTLAESSVLLFCKFLDLLMREDVGCSRAEAIFFQDLPGRRERVKSHDNASAK
jgi:hypothetical protein